MSRIIPCQKHLFDIPPGIHYFNCAYISPMMRTAKAAAQVGLDRESQPWRIRPIDFFEPVEEARGLFARIIGATADDIAIVPSTSYGIATAAKNLPLAEGQKILTLEEQFPSNVYTWREAAALSGARLEVVARPEDGDWTRAVLEALDDRVAIAALPNNHWTDGGLLDLVAIGRRVREIGAAFVLDTSQSMGALPLDVGEVRPDFLVTSGYKWMLCPYSVSFLYAAPNRQQGSPLEENGMNRRDGVDFARMAVLKDEYAAGARRFDVGERAHFTLMPATLEILRQILEWGVTDIQATLSHTTAAVAQEARDLGLPSLAPDKRAGHFLGLQFPRRDFPNGPPDSLPDALSEAGVYVSIRGSSLRVTPHLWNDEADRSALFEVLKRTL
jgi:selenocysteine lyase/cysteine desulfurase